MKHNLHRRIFFIILYQTDKLCSEIFTFIILIALSFEFVSVLLSKMLKKIENFKFPCCQFHFRLFKFLNVFSCVEIRRTGYHVMKVALFAHVFCINICHFILTEYIASHVCCIHSRCLCLSDAFSLAFIQFISP